RRVQGSAHRGDEHRLGPLWEARARWPGAPSAATWRLSNLLRGAPAGFVGPPNPQQELAEGLAISLQPADRRGRGASVQSKVLGHDRSSTSAGNPQSRVK